MCTHNLHRIRHMLVSNTTREVGGGVCAQMGDGILREGKTIEVIQEFL